MVANVDQVVPQRAPRNHILRVQGSIWQERSAKLARAATPLARDGGDPVSPAVDAAADVNAEHVKVVGPQGLGSGALPTTDREPGVSRTEICRKKAKLIAPALSHCGGCRVVEISLARRQFSAGFQPRKHRNRPSGRPEGGSRRNHARKAGLAGRKRYDLTSHRNHRGRSRPRPEALQRKGPFKKVFQKPQ